MTDPEIAELFAFASSLWPHDVAPGSEAVRSAWSLSLRRLADASLVAQTLMTMAEHHPKFPSLAQIVDAYGMEFDRRERARVSAEQAAAFKLEPPEASPIEKELARFDASARQVREERHRELDLFIASHPGAGLDGTAAAANIDAVGYCEAKARAMLERGSSAGEAGKELFHSLGEALAAMKGAVPV